MSNSLRDIKTAASQRQQEEPNQPTGMPVLHQEDPPKVKEVVADEKTKMLSFRVPWSIHREFQRQLYNAQEYYPNLTAQETMPALIRLLRDPEVWKKFINELEK